MPLAGRGSSPRFNSTLICLPVSSLNMLATMGLRIQHCAGAVPLWLAPVQVEICPVSEKVIDYGKHVHEMLKNHGIRVHLDDRNEKLPAKIRDAQLQKIPYMLVVGPREAEA